MKGTKDRIINESALLFIKKGFDGTKVAEIGEVVGISPSSIFSHFKSKEQIFELVVEKVLIHLEDPEVKFKLSENPTLEQFIELYVQGIRNTMNNLKDSLQKGNTLANYMSFTLQVCDKFGQYQEKIYGAIKQSSEIWKGQVQKAKDAGEIRSDVDVDLVAELIHSIYYGKLYLTSLEGVSLDIEKLRDTYRKLYKTLK